MMDPKKIYEEVESNLEDFRRTMTDRDQICIDVWKDRVRVVVDHDKVDESEELCFVKKDRRHDISKID